LIYDKLNLCTELRDAFNKIKNLLLHGVFFIAKAIPAIFEKIPENYIVNLMQKVKERAELVFAKVQEIPGLNMQIPEGSLYSMINVDLQSLNGIPNTLDFTEKLSANEKLINEISSDLKRHKEELIPQLEKEVENLKNTKYRKYQ